MLLCHELFCKTALLSGARGQWRRRDNRWRARAPSGCRSPSAACAQNDPWGSCLSRLVVGRFVKRPDLRRRRPVQSSAEGFFWLFPQRSHLSPNQNDRSPILLLCREFTDGSIRVGKQKQQTQANERPTTMYEYSNPDTTRSANTRARRHRMPLLTDTDNPLTHALTRPDVLSRTRYSIARVRQQTRPSLVPTSHNHAPPAASPGPRGVVSLSYTASACWRLICQSRAARPPTCCPCRQRRPRHATCWRPTAA